MLIVREKIQIVEDETLNYIVISDKNRTMVNNFIRKQWYTTKMVVRGKEFDLSKVEGIIAIENNEIKGLVTYILYDEICEIISLDSLEQSKGVGTTLLGQVINIAKKTKCIKIVLITTNDNINAMRFYQRRGFDMVRLYHNAIDMSRKLKPEIPLVGDNNIPIRHEIEFEMRL